MFDGYRSFINNPVTYPVDSMAKWVESLHENNQYYVPLIWTNVYRPNPNKSSDAYPPYQRGAELGVFIRDPRTSDFYTGVNWPGFSVWGDFMVPSSTSWWANEIIIWHDQVPFDGLLSDLSEPGSYCVGPCGEDLLYLNPVHVPEFVPGEYLAVDYDYPDGFGISNSSDLASISQDAATQSSVLRTTTPYPSPTTTTLGRVNPTPGSRNLTYPPYVINKYTFR